MEKLLCQQCVDHGLKSRVQERGSSVSCMVMHAPSEEYYDEKGSWHKHDDEPCRRLVWYQCSTGHVFSRYEPVKCPTCQFEYLPPGRSPYVQKAAESPSAVNDYLGYNTRTH